MARHFPRGTGDASRGKRSYCRCIDAGCIKPSPLVDGGLHSRVPARPDWTTPCIRCVSLAPHLRSTLPSDAPSRERPCASLVLRLHVHLNRRLSLPSMTACTAHTPAVSGGPQETEPRMRTEPTLWAVRSTGWICCTCVHYARTPSVCTSTICRRFSLYRPRHSYLSGAQPGRANNCRSIMRRVGTGQLAPWYATARHTPHEARASTRHASSAKPSLTACSQQKRREQTLPTGKIGRSRLELSALQGCQATSRPATVHLRATAAGQSWRTS